MNREKIIDEIRNYMKENAEMGWVNADEVLRKINNVIPEGSVVLTKEEYAEFTGLSESYNALEEDYHKLMKKSSELVEKTRTEVYKKLYKYATATHLLGLENPNKGVLRASMIKVLAEQDCVRIE